MIRFVFDKCHAGSGAEHHRSGEGEHSDGVAAEDVLDNHSANQAHTDLRDDNRKVEDAHLCPGTVGIDGTGED